MDSPELLVVVGPTASGKTALAIELAERHGGEILSADSVQVYRHFDIGTGKPSAAELARAPQHLLDLVEPDQTLDAARWAELADAEIRAILARGKRPIVCGGSFLWVRALLYGLAPAPPASEAIRARHRAIAAGAEGRAQLHARLAEVDPRSAARLAANDFVRVSRALEVFELSGVTLSDWHAGHGFREPRFRARLLGVRCARDELDRKIRERALRMLAAGWVDEVRALIARGYGSSRAMGSVGYKQIKAALELGPEPDVAELLESIVRATRVFARRQRTWIRDEPVTYVEANDPGALAISG